MSHEQRTAGHGPHGRSDAPGTDPISGWVRGGVAFAGVLMLCSGVLAVLQGIAAVVGDDVYGKVGNYVYRIDLTGWGWIHIVLGLAVAVTGAGVLKGAAWARYAGILLVSLSVILQFLFLPYAPFWSVIVIAIDLFVIWALTSYRIARTP
ncbi:hypothetical protein ABZ070_07275 [Streptomyces sp. NPDC006283]|uniref:DUF7144 family membrane protein n=1 Tax=Streptomyces sp. NPDC006283 TaxID=3156741 RepID=UPI0033AF7D04